MDVDTDHGDPPSLEPSRILAWLVSAIQRDEEHHPRSTSKHGEVRDNDVENIIEVLG
jgi:hypothetical protein